MSDETADSSEAWDDMDEPEPTAEELAEAASLARAMDGESEGADPKVDETAMATASLLAYSEGAAELRADRADAVLEDVLRTVRRPNQAAQKKPEKPPARRWWRVLAPLALAAVAASTFVLITKGAVVLPTPSPSLIEAQARAAAGQNAERLDAEMRAYRSELYAALEDGY